MIHSAKKDCKTLSSLGHFLKGSSATLGVTKVRDACESIQHYGALRDNKTGKVLTSDLALSKIGVVVEQAEKEYQEAEAWLRKWHSALTDEGQSDKPPKDDYPAPSDVEPANREARITLV
jgi:HPt (histidine-containing phosphotransfer) domain-containing protein